MSEVLLTEGASAAKDAPRAGVSETSAPAEDSKGKVTAASGESDPFSALVAIDKDDGGEGDGLRGKGGRSNVDEAEAKEPALRDDAPHGPSTTATAEGGLAEGGGEGDSAPAAALTLSTGIAISEGEGQRVGGVDDLSGKAVRATSRQAIEATKSGTPSTATEEESTVKTGRQHPPELANVLQGCLSTLNDFAASFETDEKVNVEDSFFWSRYNEDSAKIKDVTEHNFYKATEFSKAKGKQPPAPTFDPRTIRPIGSTGIMPSFAQDTKASSKRSRGQSLMSQAVDSNDGTLAPRYADGVVCKEANPKVFLDGRNTEIGTDAIRRGASARGALNGLHHVVGVKEAMSHGNGRKPFTHFFTKTRSPSKAIRMGVAGDREGPSRSSHVAVVEISPERNIAVESSARAVAASWGVTWGVREQPPVPVPGTLSTYNISEMPEDGYDGDDFEGKHGDAFDEFGVRRGKQKTKARASSFVSYRQRVGILARTNRWVESRLEESRENADGMTPWERTEAETVMAAKRTEQEKRGRAAEVSMRIAKAMKKREDEQNETLDGLLRELPFAFRKQVQEQIVIDPAHRALKAAQMAANVVDEEEESRETALLKKICKNIKASLRRQLTRVVDVFRSMDDDGDGTISPAEFSAGMEVLGIDCSKAEIASVFSLFDADGDGTISYQELANGLKSEKDAAALVAKKAERERKTVLENNENSANSSPKSRIAMKRQRGASLYDVDDADVGYEGEDAEDRKVLTVLNRVKKSLAANLGRVVDVFQNIDKDGDGTLDPHEFSSGLRALGLEFSQEDVDVVFAMFDSDGDGTISYAELFQTLRQKSSTTGGRGGFDREAWMNAMLHKRSYEQHLRRQQKAKLERERKERALQNDIGSKWTGAPTTAVTPMTLKRSAETTRFRRVGAVGKTLAANQLVSDDDGKRTKKKKKKKKKRKKMTKKMSTQSKEEGGAKGPFGGAILSSRSIGIGNPFFAPGLFASRSFSRPFAAPETADAVERARMRVKKMRKLSDEEVESAKRLIRAATYSKGTCSLKNILPVTLKKRSVSLKLFQKAIRLGGVTRERLSDRHLEHVFRSVELTSKGRAPIDALQAYLDGKPKPKKKTRRRARPIRRKDVGEEKGKDEDEDGDGDKDEDEDQPVLAPASLKPKPKINTEDLTLTNIDQYLLQTPANRGRNGSASSGDIESDVSQKSSIKRKQKKSSSARKAAKKAQGENSQWVDTPSPKLGVTTSTAIAAAKLLSKRARVSEGGGSGAPAAATAAARAAITGSETVKDSAESDAGSSSKSDRAATLKAMNDSELMKLASEVVEEANEVLE